jgi:hypothetical protein
LAVAGATGEIAIWECDAPGRWVERQTIKTAGHVPVALAWSPDSQRLASAGADHIVRIWDLDGETTLLSLRDVAAPTVSVSWNLPGHRLTWVSTTGRVFHWSIPGQAAAFSWSAALHQATVAANRGERSSVREHCRAIQEWAGREGRNALETREKLCALTSCAQLLQRCHLLAEAIATSRQVLNYDVARLPMSQTGETPASVIAARRINDCVAQLLSDTDLSPATRLENLEQLLNDLFLYGRSEIPIPFQVPTSDAVAPLWQQPQIVIEVARRAGALDRLRSDWENHPHADSDSLLALRIEASAAANDTLRLNQLLQGIETSSSADRLPLWSETCRLGVLRRRLKRQQEGFSEFALSSDAVRSSVSLRPDEVRIVSPDGQGQRTRLGVVRREPLTGDFEVAVDFDINALHTNGRAVGLYLQLDLLEGGEMLHFGRALSADVGHEFVAYRSQVTQDNQFTTRMWRYPTSHAQGRLILARSGGMIYWLLAEGVDHQAHVIHEQPCPTTDVAAIWLFVEDRTDSLSSRVDVVCRNLSIRTQ